MDSALQIFLTAFGGFLAASSSFWIYVKNKKESQSKAKDATTRLLMGLAHEKIVHLGLKYIDRGYVTKDEYRDLRLYLCEPYFDLGGNGTVERIMHGVERLEFRSSNPLVNIPIRGTDIDPELKPTSSTHKYTGKERRRYDG